MYQKGYRIESLSSFEPRLSSFNKWWIQLFGESEGKNNKGLFPTASIFSEELHSIGQFIQEGSNLLFETFINIKEEEDDVYPKKDQVEDGFDYLNEKGFVERRKLVEPKDIQTVQGVASSLYPSRTTC